MDGYELRLPGPQNALDIFSGDWTSALPKEYGELVAGRSGLFEDPRAEWAIKMFGGVDGRRVLELGPLEGGHSWLLERAGASDVLGIEGNRRAFLRCLVMKEICALKRVRFACGDFNEYLRTTTDSFDIIFASGVLYHQLDPMQMLFDLSRCASKVYLWTHYYDADRIAANAALGGKVGALTQAEFADRPYQRAEFHYLKALNWSGFCGGALPNAYWLPRAVILEALNAFGFKRIDIAFENPDHVNGPSFALVGQR